MLKWIMILCTGALCSCISPEFPIYGEWEMIDWNGAGKPALDISLTFRNNKEYQDSRSEDAIWNYEYFEPDSLILYHHGLYEERYKIITLTHDTLRLRLVDSKFHAEDNGKDVISDYYDSINLQYTFIRIN